MEIEIDEIIIDKDILIDDIELDIVKVFPELEDLEITPSGEEQNFKSSKYGYNNVKVKAVEGEELNIIPSMENQQYKGLYSDVNVDAIESEEITVTPSATEQVKEGMYNKVTVAGDNNLVAENIKEGTSIFGVEGNAKTASAKITDGKYLFYQGTRTDYLNEILGLCTKFDSTYYMFNGASKITEVNLEGRDTSNLTNMGSMFTSCTQLKNVYLSDFNTSKVTDMGYMFSGCSSLTSLDISNFNTSNVTTMAGMFNGCNKFVTLDLSNFDMGKVANIMTAFSYCSQLINLISFKNLGKGYTRTSNNYSNYTLDLSTCYSLSYESLIDIITNGLYDLNLTYNVANGGTLYTQQLKLGSSHIAKLTSGELNIATSKGWTVI